MSFGMYAIQFYIQSSLPLLRRFLQVSLCYISIIEWMDFFVSGMKRRNQKTLFHMMITLLVLYPASF